MIQMDLLFRPGLGMYPENWSLVVPYYVNPEFWLTPNNISAIFLSMIVYTANNINIAPMFLSQAQIQVWDHTLNSGTGGWFSPDPGWNPTASYQESLNTPNA